MGAMSEASRECRLRLRWPNGAEFEAEGSSEFVARERGEFLARTQTASAAPASSTPSTLGATPLLGDPAIAWEAITDHHGSRLQLRGKLGAGKTEKDACLVLLAASEKRLQQPRPTATQLAKWLRSSGYPVQRMDRALRDAVGQGEILSSGSRRARRYELTASGRLKGLLLAEQLSRLITS